MDWLNWIMLQSRIYPIQYHCLPAANYARCPFNIWCGTTLVCDSASHYQHELQWLSILGMNIFHKLSKCQPTRCADFSTWFSSLYFNIQILIGSQAGISNCTEGYGNHWLLSFSFFFGLAVVRCKQVVGNEVWPNKGKHPPPRGPDPPTQFQNSFTIEEMMRRNR